MSMLKSKMHLQASEEYKTISGVIFPNPYAEEGNLSRTHAGMAFGRVRSLRDCSSIRQISRRPFSGQYQFVYPSAALRTIQLLERHELILIIYIRESPQCFTLSAIS
jgi:hypothetical protein